MLQTSEQSDFPLISLLLAQANKRPAGSFTRSLHHAVHGSNKNIHLEKKLDFLSSKGKSNYSVMLQRQHGDVAVKRSENV